MEAELEKLESNLGGVADMRRQPDAIFIVDLRKEQLAVREAKRLGLPTVWIDRRGAEKGWGATPPPSAVVAPDWTFRSMAAFASACLSPDND